MYVCKLIPWDGDVGQIFYFFWVPEYFQLLHHLPGQFIPIPDHPFSEVPPDVQPEPPLAPLEAMSSCVSAQ